ncbi:MAG: hypothetical protein EON98_14635 [Chitinophagaceae bacterium]|nr:MAG: hypothetical protein EON98_14635 [Chitinophagaceae bacterium]
MKQDKANQNLQRQPLFSKNFLQWSLMATFFVAMACKKDIQSDAITPDDTALNTASKATKAPVVTVRAGSSIQSAINAAAAGTTIKIQPGVYYESIVVDKPNITLDGEGGVTIENPGGAADIGIKVNDGGDGFTLKNVTLKNFKEHL